jgi:aldose 1-epimerase
MITIQRFGTLPNGEAVQAYRLRSASGISATLLSYGATLQSLCLPNGRDIVLGFDNLEPYLGEHPYFGAAIGRVANRIEKGQFDIDGRRFNVTQNENGNSLHSGPIGFDRVNWEGDIEGNAVIFRHVSADGHQGFPGTVRSEFRYVLDDEGLRIDMRAETDKPTPINLTAHSYFNLGGETICDHALSFKASHYYETDGTGINHGKALPVTKSPFDFLASQKISKAEIDNHFIVPETGMRKMATLFSPDSLTRLKVLSDQAGLQIYTAFNMADIKGKGGALYSKFAGIAFEPQSPPNALNLPNLPSIILRPGEVWAKSILYKIESLR